MPHIRQTAIPFDGAASFAHVDDFTERIFVEFVVPVVGVEFLVVGFGPDAAALVEHHSHAETRQHVSADNRLLLARVVIHAGRGGLLTIDVRQRSARMGRHQGHAEKSTLEDCTRRACQDYHHPVGAS